MYSALRHCCTLNSREAASPPKRLVDWKKGWETPDPPPGCSSSKLLWNHAKSYCHLYGAQDYSQRRAYMWSIAMMNSVDLNLTQSRSGGIRNNAQVPTLPLSTCGS
ncbi:hypothetical protein TNCV_522831 [Trichonephila clavipes]|nr:hypothetical protein TNCV_522831 [Trichonephila clavipes]